MKHLLLALKEVRSGINMQNVIQFLNDKDVDYIGWSDVDMIIWYIENYVDEDEEPEPTKEHILKEALYVAFKNLNEHWIDSDNPNYVTGYPFASCFNELTAEVGAWVEREAEFDFDDVDSNFYKTLQSRIFGDYSFDWDDMTGSCSLDSNLEDGGAIYCTPFWDDAKGVVISVMKDGVEVEHFTIDCKEPTTPEEFETFKIWYIELLEKLSFSNGENSFK